METLVELTTQGELSMGSHARGTLIDKGDFPGGKRGEGPTRDRNSLSPRKDKGECTMCSGNGEGVKEGSPNG